MCKVGDIIVVKNYQSNGVNLQKHSFIVISDEADQIQGLDYDLICNVMSSFKDDLHKTKKLGFPGNFPIETCEENIRGGGHQKDGYVKAEQLYYFNKNITEFFVLGSLSPEAFSKLIEFIEKLDEIVHIIDNL